MLWDDFRAKCESVGKIYLNSLLRLFVWSNCAIGNYCNWYIVSVFLFQLFNCLLQGLPTFSSSRTTKWSEKCWRTTKIAKKKKYSSTTKYANLCAVVIYLLGWTCFVKIISLFLYCKWRNYHSFFLNIVIFLRTTGWDPLVFCIFLQFWFCSRLLSQLILVRPTVDTLTALPTIRTTFTSWESGKVKF